MTIPTRTVALHLRTRANIGIGSRFDWCVDSVNGDDARTGAGPSQSLKTIAALLTKTIVTGQKVGLARGSHWREQLTVPCAGTTIDAYGSGADPILDASDVIATFTKTGGQTNVYQASVTTAAVFGEQYINGWEDGAFMTRATSVANCDATPGSHYPTAEFGAITWYIHPTGSGNPNTNGKIYEVSTRNYGLLSQYNTQTLSGFETRNNQNCGGSMSLARSCTVTNVICRNGSKHNLIFGDGTTLNSVQALTNYCHNSSQTLFVWNENTPISLGITFNDCIADSGTVAMAGCTGYYGHKNVSGDFGTITFNRCIARNCYVGFEPVDCVAVLNDCVSDVTVDTVLRPWCANTTVTNCLFSSSSTTIEFQGTNQHITVSGGTFTIPNPGASRDMILISAPYTGVVLTMTGVTFNNLSLPFPNTVISYAANTTINISNCTWLAAGLSCYVFIDTTGMVIASDYNAFKAASTWYLNPAGYTFAQWQAAGYDAHSTHA